MQGFDKLPSKLNGYVQSIIDKNPNWNILKYDDTSIREELKNLGQEYLDKYNNYALLHQKVDLARLCLLYIHGGVATDTDIIALKGFDSTPSLDTSDFIVSEMPHKKAINNATILCSKNNPIMKYVIDNIPNTPCKSGEGNFYCIQRTTGPYAFNKLLKNYKGQITVLPKVYFEPCSSYDPYCFPDPNLSILNHKHELSWLKQWHKEGIKIYFEVKHYRYQILIGLIILILIIILISRNKS
jgi:mannosyltransferase OCH1-like enzyme